MNLPTITAAINNDIIFKGPGIYKLDLYHPSTGSSLKIGNFKIIPKDKEPLYINPNMESNRSSIPPMFIAHAGGGYKKQAYTNSIDALNHNYSLGHRVFEIDFNWTSDAELVGIHDWGDSYAGLFNQHTKAAPSLKEFKSLKMHNGQTQITLVSLDNWLSKHPDASIVTDVRWRNVEALKLMAKQMKHTLKQVIPQMYHPTNYETLKSIGYKDIIFTLYATKLSADQIIEFSTKNSLYAVTIHPSKESFNKIIKALSESNVFSYVHTFNTLSEVKSYLSQGVNGVYTDFLYIDENNQVMNQQ